VFVADQRVVPRQLAIKMPPDRALEIEFEMRHPVSGIDQLRPAADARIGELHAISRDAKLNLLFVPRFGSMSVWSWMISNGLSEFRLRQHASFDGGGRTSRVKRCEASKPDGAVCRC
jgi:hypothetical protein